MVHTALQYKGTDISKQRNRSTVTANAGWIYAIRCRPTVRMPLAASQGAPPYGPSVSHPSANLRHAKFTLNPGLKKVTETPSDSYFQYRIWKLAIQLKKHLKTWLS